MEKIRVSCASPSSSCCFFASSELFIISSSEIKLYINSSSFLPSFKIQLLLSLLFSSLLCTPHLPRLSIEVAPCTLLPTVASKFLLAGKTILLIPLRIMRIMSPLTALEHRKGLEGVHGVRVVPHLPFALEDINQHGDIPSTHDKSFITANQPLLMQVWQQRPACLRPVRCCMQGDQNLIETVANVLTSLPFIALGIQAPRKNFNTKLYANSLIGVGVVSTFYHSSRGNLRKYLRWADYTMIATASVCLSRALRNENPKLLMAASALLLPVQPLMVSAVHTGMMEVAFAKRALKDPELRMAHNVHKMSSLLGGALFIADDLFPTTPFLHAAWHLAAAVGVGTCNKLLE